MVCHVKNTGRCKELLVPGARAVVEAAPPSSVRKTRYDLVSVYKGERLVNIDSQAPNRIFGEWAREQGFSLIRPEYTFGSSRLDYYLEKDGKKILAEVKGVTLELDNVAMFPDAPTERGVKHVRELQRALSLGYEARIYFVIQMMGVKLFTPSLRHHPEFFEALQAADAAGVQVYAAECLVTPDEVTWADFVPVKYIRQPYGAVKQ